MPLQFSRQPPTVLCKQALSTSVLRLSCSHKRKCSRRAVTRLHCGAKEGLCVQDAWALLHKLTKEDIKGNSSHLTASLDARSLLREAVEVIATNAAPAEGWDPSIQPPEILLGVLSSDIRLAVRALRDWASALHVPFVIPTSRVEGVSVTSLRGSVYIKYNAVSQQCYATQYSGTDRGVLVTFGGSLVGHLPLGLFDESMQQAPPSLS